MIDIQLIRDNPELVKQKSAQKNVDVDIDKLLKLDQDRRLLIGEVESIRAERNLNTEKIKQAGGPPAQDLINEGRQIKIQLAEKETYLEELSVQWLAILKKVPNMPEADVPVGSSEEENIVVKTVGEPTKFSFEPKSHDELGKTKDLIDKDRASKISGARFAYLKGDLVLLQQAMMSWVYDVLTDQKIIEKLIIDNKLNLKPTPFIPILPPVMMRTDAYEATGRLKAEEVTYKLADDDLWLIGSAEHSLCAMYQNEVIPQEKLPIRYIGYTTSFRREAGTYGKDLGGIIRLHHFDKLEMEVFSDSETSRQEHELLVVIQEYLVSQLDLPYRLLNKCTADIGDPNARGVDLEVWEPSRQAYRETHSADYMTDFQARGLNTRYKNQDGNMEFVHTNDATAFALGRINALILENNQQADGSINIPEVLKPYMAGRQTI